ncbi:MAG: head-tail adaptor protein [Planctomycetia bacterium]
MIATGRLIHRFELQRPVQTRNASGESITTWSKVRDFMGSYDQESFVQAQRRGQIGGNRQATVSCRKFDGVEATMQLKCLSRNGDIMKISSVVEADGDLVLTVEESVA